MKPTCRFVGLIIAVIGLSFYLSGKAIASAHSLPEFIQELLLAAQEAEGSGDSEELEYRLVTIISEPENNLVHQVDLFTTLDDEITSLTRTSIQDTQVIEPEDLFEHEVLLAKSGKYDAVFLGCIGCSVETGGEIYIRYLHNGAMMKYRKFYMKLRFNGSEWNLYTDEGELIETLTLRKRTILGALIGIDKIDVNAYQK